MHQSKILDPFFSEPTVTSESYERTLRYYGMPNEMKMPNSTISRQVVPHRIADNLWKVT